MPRSWTRYAAVIKESGQLSAHFDETRSMLVDDWADFNGKLHRSVEIIKVRITEIPRRKRGSTSRRSR